MTLLDTLSEIEARAAKATPGPWIYDGQSLTVGNTRHMLRADGVGWIGPDAAFAADSRLTVPRLCKALRVALDWPTTGDCSSDCENGAHDNSCPVWRQDWPGRAKVAAALAGEGAEAWDYVDPVGAAVEAMADVLERVRTMGEGGGCPMCSCNPCRPGCDVREALKGYMDVVRT